MNYVPHQAHTNHLPTPLSILRIKTISEEWTFPVTNPQKQEAKPADSHPNARRRGWSLGLSCPQGLQKQKAITDGLEINGNQRGNAISYLRALKHLLHATTSHPRRERAQDMVTWIPNPYYFTNSVTQSSSSSYDTRMRWWKKRERTTATAEAPDVTSTLLRHLTAISNIGIGTLHGQQ